MSIWKSRVVSDPVAWRLLDMAYADSVPLWAYLVLCTFLGGIAFRCMRDAWSAGWAVLGIVLAVAGLVDRHFYPARRATCRLVFAQNRFMAISALHGTYWGLANLVLLLSPNPHLQFWVIDAQTAVLGLTIARLNPMEAAIRTELAIVLVSLIICCLLTRNSYFLEYAVLVLLYMFASFAVIRDLNDKTLRLLTSEENNVALVLGVTEANARLDAANRRLEAMATTDGLTGIPNRRCFDDTIRGEWDRAARAGTNLSMLLIDIDHFKAYNDTLGHLAGDSCLRAVAEGLAGAIRRPADLAARYGGEEFAVIITGTDEFGTLEIAERLRLMVEDMALPHPGGGVVSVSIGAALCKPAISASSGVDEAPAHGIAALIAEADANLYAAKRAGRNRVWQQASDVVG